MISGGQKAMMSPMARMIRPSSWQSSARRAPNEPGGAKGALARLVGDEFQRADQADAARLADQGMAGEALQARLEMRRKARRIAHQIALVENVEIFQRDRRADGMAAGGEAVREHADLVGIVGDRLIDRIGEDERRKRKVGRGQRLRHDEDIRLDAVGLTAEHPPGAPEPGDDLVGDDEHVVAPAHRLDLFPIGSRRRHDAARPHHRLADERGDRVRPLGEDQRLEFVGQARRRTLPRSRREGRSASDWGTKRGASSAAADRSRDGRPAGPSGCPRRW